MGRQLRRVPLDFNWPMNERWSGFLNPHYVHSSECPSCGGSGSSPAAKLFSDQWYGNAPFDPVAYGSQLFSITEGPVFEFAKRNVERHPDFYIARRESKEAAIKREAIRLGQHFNSQWAHHLSDDDVAALVAADRLRGFDGRTPTAKELNDAYIFGLGHDAINQWVCVKARCAREGVEQTECDTCHGDGDVWDSPENKAICEAWQETEPPTGDGYQLWETVSEGSPISPVFATASELAAWLADHPRGVTSDMTREDWERFINGPGWAPSMVAGPDGLTSGAKAVTGATASR